jgi:hypothetical protein
MDLIGHIFLQIRPVLPPKLQGIHCPVASLRGLCPYRIFSPCFPSGSGQQQLPAVARIVVTQHHAVAQNTSSPAVLHPNHQAIVTPVFL